MKSRVTPFSLLHEESKTSKVRYPKYSPEVQYEAVSSDADNKEKRSQQTRGAEAPILPPKPDFLKVDSIGPLGSGGQIGNYQNHVEGHKTGSLAKAPKLTAVDSKSTARLLSQVSNNFRRGAIYRHVAALGDRTKSVVKSRFQRNTGTSATTGKLQAHASYLSNRPGMDKDGMSREFYTSSRTGLKSNDVFREAKNSFGRPAAYHKVILSPGDNSIHLTGYTREVMQRWQDEMGRQFNWWAVNHYNTDHYHSHVIVAGRDFADRPVNFDRENLALCREISDDYLSRDRFFDRALDRKADIQLDLMSERFDLASKVYDFGMSRPRDLLDQIDLGMRTDGDYQNEWKSLGLNRIYEMGRPFETYEPSSREGEYTGVKTAETSTAETAEKAEPTDGVTAKVKTTENSKPDNGESGSSDNENSPQQTQDPGNGPEAPTPEPGESPPPPTLEEMAFGCGPSSTVSSTHESFEKREAEMRTQSDVSRHKEVSKENSRDAEAGKQKLKAEATQRDRENERAKETDKRAHEQKMDAQEGKVDSGDQDKDRDDEDRSR